MLGHEVRLCKRETPINERHTFNLHTLILDQLHDLVGVNAIDVERGCQSLYSLLHCQHTPHQRVSTRWIHRKVGAHCAVRHAPTDCNRRLKGHTIARLAAELSARESAKQAFGRHSVGMNGVCSVDLAKPGLDRARGQSTDLGEVAVKGLVRQQKATSELLQWVHHLHALSSSWKFHRVSVAVGSRMLHDKLVIKNGTLDLEIIRPGVTQSYVPVQLCVTLGVQVGNGCTPEAVDQRSPVQISDLCEVAGRTHGCENRAIFQRKMDVT